MNKKLIQVFNEHKVKASDKWALYLDVYDKEFSKFCDKNISLLEIGVQNGGSLEVWNKYFNPERIVGCDINPKCENLVYESDKINILVDDINKESSFAYIKSQFQSGIDIIIDDGSHTSSDIIRTFEKYFPLLNEDGLFVFEDLHCSYWKEFEGGLYDPLSSISFFKRLIDIVNHEHWGVTNKKRTDVLTEFEKHYNIKLDDDILSCIHSIRFYNSICIIEKRKKEYNELGQRCVTGCEQNVISLDDVGDFCMAYNQDENLWSKLEKSPDSFYKEFCENDKNPGEIIQLLNSKVDTLSDYNKKLEFKNEEFSSELNKIKSSFFWKLFSFLLK